MFTPWGNPIKTLRLEPGITVALTARHGGLMLARGYAERRLSMAAQRRGIRFGEYYTYEIDHAWAMPIIELPHLWEGLASFCKPHIGKAAGPALRELLSVYHPDYLREAEGQTSLAPAASAPEEAVRSA